LKTVVVTGGAGFIGSHLCEALLKEGYKAINIDNFNGFYEPAIKRKNVRETVFSLKSRHIEESAYQVEEGDIRDFTFLEKVFNKHSVDIIVHLAAYAGVRPSIQKPRLYADVNINGTVNILEMSKLFNISGIIFASSSSVYGNNIKIPFSEEDSVDFPISPYAATKKAGELLCHAYHSLYKMNIMCLRLFTVYGPRQRPDLAIHRFTRLIAENEEIPFYGDGLTERDYTYIDDVIDGILRAIDWVSSGTRKYEIINLGRSNTISLIEMIKTIEEILGKRAKVSRMPLPPGDVNRTCADISKARRILGFNPQTCFNDGISKFVEWFIKNQST